MKIPTNFVEDTLDLIGTYRYHFILSFVYVVVIIATAFYLLTSVSAAYEAQQPVVDEANTLYSAIRTMKDRGLTVNEFMTIGKGMGSEVSPETFQDQTKLQKAITKSKSFRGEYLAWLGDEMKLSEKRSIEIDNNDRILKGILPTFLSTNSRASATLAASGESITLENFIEYVETNILRKFDIDSNAAIGIDNLEFKENKAGTLNVGSFRINIDFQGDIRSIRKMVEFIQSSGQFSIKDGRLEGLSTTGEATKLSKNLLVNIVEISVNGWLLPDDPLVGEGAVTSGSMTLEFYVQWSSTQKVLLLRKQVAEQYKTLQKKITSYDSYCEKTANSPCATETVRIAVVTIRNQNSSLEAYSDRMKELDRRKEVSKVDQETEELLMYKKAFEQIENLVDRNVRVIDATASPNTKEAPKKKPAASGATTADKQ